MKEFCQICYSEYIQFSSEINGEYISNVEVKLTSSWTI